MSTGRVPTGTSGSPGTPAASTGPSPVVAASTTGPASPTVTRTGPAPAPIGSAVLFDDFSYTGPSDSRFTRVWSVRTGKGGPGVQGASWSLSAISFNGGGASRTMLMTASTDGTAAKTEHAEIDSTRQRFFDGTYATRIRFTDAPAGPNGAHVYQTFFTITPLARDNDPSYSEMDFEYLPAGGWGDNRRQLDLTTWYTFSESSGKGDSRSAVKAQSYDGWHTLVMQVGAGTVTYLVDGVAVFATDGKYYPRQPMFLCFNIWYIDGEIGPAGAVRSYRQEVDWVYYVGGHVVAPAAVQAQVDAYRAAGRTLVDTL
ncbi:glycosyl hydrolase [Dactylosporangium sp. AC04546]|uniref:glycoside hydrolase family 16 protein n=1 Tax=Dactylosporangium sp. AC04546 TaxID=2862460 RepID=UPI001EDDFE82|nr:glycoside hydrolase family 16 protein [Dactylosporangium sp. AC04546]WVK86686.1 glycosyl hydrolase [Dactylosporangium sp. AC04546]